MEYAVIMAGGRGTRLWPFSRNEKPKQLLPLIGGKSLLRLSYERMLALLPPERIYVCTAAAHRDAILAALPELPPENLLGEPEGRDTANAIGFSATVLLKKDPEAVMAVVTADHVIEPLDAFVGAFRTAFEVVAQNPRALVTFGIVPKFAHTGLGYVERGDPQALKSGATGAFRVLHFTEKPDKETAEQYVMSDRYYWNSGMFVWRCDTVLQELAIHLPPVFQGLSAIGQAWGTADQQAVLQRTYPTLTRKSIDFAVMEPASRHRGKAQVFVVALKVNWLDVGSWPALAETIPSDDHDNSIDAPVAVLVDSFNNIVISRDPEHLISLVGVNDMIVVHTADATLICPKNDAERVKTLVDAVEKKTGPRYQ